MKNKCPDISLPKVRSGCELKLDSARELSTKQKREKIEQTKTQAKNGTN